MRINFLLSSRISFPPQSTQLQIAQLNQHTTHHQLPYRAVLALLTSLLNMSQLYPQAQANYIPPTQSSSSNKPTQEDWKRHRKLLTRLWSVEDKKLHEVMAIMTPLGHIATERMYKYHFQIWKLDKKFKARDVVTMRRKLEQRDAVGKQTTFIVRGKPVDMKHLTRYLERRKETPIEYDSRASTPSDIECQTPPPMDGFQNTDDSHMNRFGASAMHFDHFMIPKTRLEENFSENLSRISQSPSLPKSFMLPEQLFYHIKSYIRGSWESGFWVTDEEGYGITLNSTASTAQSDAQFLRCCEMAVDFLEAGLLNEFWRMLSMGFSFVKDLLQAQAPNTLNRILCALVYLTNHNRQGIAFMLCTHISQMASEILQKDHPWYQICRSLGTLDVNTFEEVIMQSWKCQLDISTECLGLFHRFSLDSRLDFINRSYGLKGLRIEERMLRELLMQAEHQVPSVLAMVATDIMIDLGCNMLSQRRYSETEKICEEIMSQYLQDDGSVDVDDKIRALILIAYCQIYQDKDELAESSLREAIHLAIETWGANCPKVIDIMFTLERWLRRWDREYEADEINAERERHMDFNEMIEGLDKIVL